MQSHILAASAFHRVRSDETIKELRKHSKNANWWYNFFCWKKIFLPGGPKKSDPKRCLHICVQGFLHRWLLLFLAIWLARGQFKLSFDIFQLEFEARKLCVSRSALNKLLKIITFLMKIFLLWTVERNIFFFRSRTYHFYSSNVFSHLFRVRSIFPIEKICKTADLTIILRS